MGTFCIALHSFGVDVENLHSLNVESYYDCTINNVLEVAFKSSSLGLFNQEEALALTQFWPKVIVPTRSETLYTVDAPKDFH